MKWAAMLVPLLFLGVFLFAALRRVKVYDSFAEGAAGALPLLKNLFPYIAAVLVLAELFEASGLSACLQTALSPAFAAVGIPPEIAPLVLIKPFSGSGSTALLADLCTRYGADSTIAAAPASYMPRATPSSTCPPFGTRARPSGPRCPPSSRSFPISLLFASDACSAAFCEK